MTINLVVAVDEKNGMGLNNQLPWHLPADLRHFKTLTTGHPIIMGRKTFDSIGKPLPNRRNVIVSRQKDLEIFGAEVCHSLEDAFQLCADADNVFVIGGAQIFSETISIADVIHLTLIHHTFRADTFFPEIEKTQWKEEKSIRHQPDEKNIYSYTFIKYQKA